MKVRDLDKLAPWEYPPITKDLVLGALRDRHAPGEDRLAAASAAGAYTVIDDEVAEALLACLDDRGEPEDLRAQAVIAFGAALEGGDTYGFDDEVADGLVPVSEPMFSRITATLARSYADASLPKLVRRRILEASVRAPQPWHDGAVRAAWASGDPEWRLSAVFAMGYLRGFDEGIVAALASPDPDLRYEAVVAAGRAQVDAAWEPITDLLDAETPKDLLLAAVEAAASIRPGEAPEYLLDLEDSPDPEIAEAAMDAVMTARTLDPDATEEDVDDSLADGYEDDEDGRPQ